MPVGVSGEVDVPKLWQCSRSRNSIAALQFVSLTWKLKSPRRITEGEMEHS